VIFQVSAIQGILAFSQRTVADIMIPLSKVRADLVCSLALTRLNCEHCQLDMLEANTILDEAMLTQIYAHGHTHIPVYEHSRNNVIGLLIVKRLLLVSFV
jgi:CBS domain containing-hemolysin-like protein